ncbi:ABC transporter permease [Aminipila sp.]|uniref:ABC transporter permease n=1 Tax=Aminipila sp. TaxID=2060095 RepID=UPI00289C572A|nr:ABC transporter permease [Aminipila sp.]
MHYLAVFNKYKFLLSQLVARDFKTKYKRSILGVLWSLLNPLLIMIVQYMVFSELFRWDIDNFAVYLLSGTVMFNFFQESTSQALLSITGNSTLITKVYVPMYIFPLSKVISSCINLGFSLIALFAIVLIQGLPFNIYYFLIPYSVLCMLLFSIGMSFILASMMVYFRDTQFLYGVALTAWSYLTPLFYPETILPEKFMIFMQCNPMYHFIRYVRNIILDGSLPTMRAHILCLIFAVIPCMIGMLIFNKAKKNFILNI